MNGNNQTYNNPKSKDYATYVKKATGAETGGNTLLARPDATYDQLYQFAGYMTAVAIEGLEWKNELEKQAKHATDPEKKRNLEAQAKQAETFTNEIYEIRDKLRDKADKMGKNRHKPTLDEMKKKFEDKTAQMEEDIKKILNSLSYEDQYINTVGMVKQLDAEFDELKGLAKELRGLIDEFKNNNLGDPKITVHQIETKMRELSGKLRNIKLTQRDQYNSKVRFVNSKIDRLQAELKNRLSDPSIDPSTRSAIESLTHLKEADGTLRDPGNLGYLKNIDYNKLLGMMKLTDELYTKLGIKPQNVDLESDMQAIESKLKEISNRIAPELELTDILKLKDDLNVVNNLIVIFETKLSANKDKVAPDVYAHYEQRLNDAKAESSRLSQELGKIKIPGKENSVYLGFQRELDILKGKVIGFDSRIAKGSIVKDDLPRWNNDLKSLEDELEKIGDRIDEEATKDNSALENNQINNLSALYNEIKQKIDECKKKLGDPENIKDVGDIFVHLNGEIDDLEKDITNLENYVNNLPKPIKDKQTRKNIEKTIIELEGEIKRITANLEKYKDKDEQKYNECKERLNKAEQRLAKVSKLYRKKCPLRIRAWKSAKNFYQKHKKAILIAAGLAAVALLFQPVIVPAIMQGNIMIGDAVPALHGILSGLNKVLGSAIGAKLNASGAWILKDFVISPSYAMSSLVRGIAMSGIMSAVTIAPVVAAIKALIEKMKNKEKKIVEKTEKDKEDKEKKKQEKQEERKKKRDERKKKIKDKLDELKKDKNKLNEFKKQLTWYGKYNAAAKADPNMTKEEFIRQNNLPDKYMKIFIQFENSEFAGYVYGENEEEILTGNKSTGRSH